MKSTQGFALTAIGLRLLLARLRRLGLMHVMGEVVAIVQQEQGLHFSDVLQGLSDYANQENVDESPEIRQTWKTVASLLAAAAQEAETQGRELP